MITFKQIKKASEIKCLSNYYVFDLRTTGPDPAVNAISSVSVLVVENDTVVQKAVVRITSDSAIEAESDLGYRNAEQVAETLSRLLINQVVISEPSALQFLRALLEKHGYEGEITFVPVVKLVSTLFPGVSSDSIQEQARQLEISEHENVGLLRTAYFENELFRRCRKELGASLSENSEGTGRHDSDNKKQSDTGKSRYRISSRTLKRWAKSVWSVSPWVVVGVSFLLVLFVVIHLPRKEKNEIDRNTAPVNYLVISWDQTGKYGTRPKSSGNEEAPIQFRVPYGVYNVLNNNSIPVELNVLTDTKPSGRVSENSDPGPDGNLESSDENSSAVELSSNSRGATDLQDDEDEESRSTKVIMRPNSTRQITIDTDQYLTLSEDANDLILFYVSEVPEERESDTTGRDNGESSRVVYAYVKGTEVRFRKSPSLEGAIIDILQNGQQVQVLGVTGEWTHVSVQKEKGYIFSQYLTSEDPQAAAYEAKKAEEAAKLAESTTSADPSTNAEIPVDSAVSADIEADNDVTIAQPDT